MRGYMKKALLLGFLFLSACSPHFKAGDCVAMQSRFDAPPKKADFNPTWDGPFIEKIIKVTDDRYYFEYVSPPGMAATNGYKAAKRDQLITIIDRIYNKVECP